MYIFYEFFEKLNKEKGIMFVFVIYDIGIVLEKVIYVVCLNKFLYFYGNVKEFE